VYALMCADAGEWKARAEKAEASLGLLRGKLGQVVAEIGAEREQNAATIVELQRTNEELQGKLERAVEVLRRARDERAAQEAKIAQVIEMTRATRTERDTLRTQLADAERKVREAEAAASVAASATTTLPSSAPSPAAASSLSLATELAAKNSHIKQLEAQIEALRRDLNEANAALGFSVSDLPIPGSPSSPLSHSQSPLPAAVPAPAPMPDGRTRCKSEIPAPRDQHQHSRSEAGVVDVRQMTSGSRRTTTEQGHGMLLARARGQGRKEYRQSIALNDLLRDVSKT
jgi:hypothetical protein